MRKICPSCFPFFVVRSSFFVKPETKNEVVEGVSKKRKADSGKLTSYSLVLTLTPLSCTYGK